MALGDGDEDGACDSVALRAGACCRAKRAARSHPGSPRRRRSPVLPSGRKPRPRERGAEASSARSVGPSRPRPPHTAWRTENTASDVSLALLTTSQGARGDDLSPALSAEPRLCPSNRPASVPVPSAPRPRPQRHRPKGQSTATARPVARPRELLGRWGRSVFARGTQTPQARGEADLTERKRQHSKPFAVPAQDLEQNPAPRCVPATLLPGSLSSPALPRRPRLTGPGSLTSGHQPPPSAWPGPSHPVPVRWDLVLRVGARIRPPPGSPPAACLGGQVAFRCSRFHPLLVPARTGEVTTL